MAKKPYDVFSDYLNLSNIVKPKVTKDSKCDAQEEFIEHTAEKQGFREFNPTLENEEEQSYELPETHPSFKEFNPTLKYREHTFSEQSETPPSFKEFNPTLEYETSSDLSDEVFKCATWSPTWDCTSTQENPTHPTPRATTRRYTAPRIYCVDTCTQRNVETSRPSSTAEQNPPNFAENSPTRHLVSRSSFTASQNPPIVSRPPSPKAYSNVDTLCRLFTEECNTAVELQNTPCETEMNISCNFCKTNGERPQFYSSHRLKDRAGKVVCPVLRSFRCPICNSTGDNAHTVTYCPFGRGNASTMTAARTTRKGCGCIRSSDRKSCKHHQKYK